MLGHGPRDHTCTTPKRVTALREIGESVVQVNCGLEQTAVITGEWLILERIMRFPLLSQDQTLLLKMLHRISLAVQVHTYYPRLPPNAPKVLFSILYYY